MMQFKISFQRIFLISVILLTVALPTQAKDKKVDRPAGTMVLFASTLNSESPQERGAHWWEIHYKNGKVERSSTAPAYSEQIRYVRYCINDYEKNTTSLGAAGTLIKISPLDTVTYHYPAFWSGTSWLTEDQLERKAPAVYKQIKAKATLEHRAIIRIRLQAQAQIALSKSKAQIEEHKLQLSQKNLSAEQKKYLAKRLQHYQSQYQHNLKLSRSKASPVKAEPITIVRAYRFPKAIEEAQRDEQELVAHLLWLKKEIGQTQGLKKEQHLIERAQKLQELQALRQTIPQYKAAQAQFIKKGWILDY